MDQLFQQYDAFGNNLSPQQYQNSPLSNTGIVYQPSNTPTAPGAFIGGQAVNQTTWQSNYSGRRMRITMSPGVTPFQSAGSLAIIDPQNIIRAQLGGSLTESELQIYRAPTDVTDQPLVHLQDDSSGLTGPNSIIEMVAKDTDASTHFQPFFQFVNRNSLATLELWIGDGTNPNGTLSAPKGSLCLNSSATGQIAYNNNGTTGWTLL